MFGLSKGERLFIVRRRLGETQAQAAKRHNISMSLYSLWERDRRDATTPVVGIGDDLARFEKARILRRRKGITQIELSQRIRCSEEWVKLMERGKANGKALFEYWGI